MLIAVAPLVVLLAGLLLYVLASNPKLQRIGEIALFCGLLVLVWVLAQHTVRIG